ncbi:MAG: type II toxin-antitoxin system HicB family antitoxin [Patescibacteria group bacterium]
MKKIRAQLRGKQFHVIVERDNDGYYTVECPLFQGCYTQGKTLDQALKNIREVIELCLEEKNNQKVLSNHKSSEFSVHTISL